VSSKPGPGNEGNVYMLEGTDSELDAKPTVHHLQVTISKYAICPISNIP
jgi:hypothetical protein